MGALWRGRKAGAGLSAQGTGRTWRAGVMLSAARTALRAGFQGAKQHRAAALMAAMTLAGCASDFSVSSLSPADQADAQRVERYLNGVTSLHAAFHQVWPDGGVSEGSLAYTPAHLMMDYTEPHVMHMVAGDGRIVLKDENTGSTTHMGLSHSPLGLLLNTPIHLSGAIIITAIQHGAGVLQLSLAASENPSQGLLTLGFVDQGGMLSLSTIETTDAQRRHTKIFLQNVQG